MPDLQDMVAEDNAVTPPTGDAPTSQEPASSQPPADQGASDDASTSSPSSPSTGDPQTPASDGTPAEPSGSGKDDQTPASPSESAFLAKAKEIAGRDWVDKYKTEEDFVKGFDNLQTLMGQRDQNSQIVRALEEAGVSNDDIVALIQAKQNPSPAPAQQPAQQTPEWDPSWATRDADGNIVPTAAAPPDFEARARRRQAKVAEAMLDDSKLADLVAPHITSRMSQMTDDNKRVMDQRVSEVEAKVAQREWAKSNHDKLFNNGTPSELGKLANQILTGGTLNPSLPWTEAADQAMKFAANELGIKAPNQTTKPTADRQVPPASQPPKKTTDDDFFKQQAEDGAKPGFMDFVQHAQPDDFKKK